MISKYILVITAAAIIGAIGCSNDSKSGGDSGGNAATPVVDPTVVKEDVAGGSLPGIEWSLVKFDFISPNDADDLTGGQVKIEVAHNLPPIATWTLLYNKSFKSIEGGTVIAENQAATVKKVDWDVSKMEPGNYFIFAVIKYGTDQNVRFLTSAVPVEDEAGDNRTPFMSLITNINARVIAPGAVQPMQFIGVDPDGDDVKYALEYTADDGANWTSVFKDLTIDSPLLVPDPIIQGQVTYTWTMPAGLARGARYRARLTGKDTQGKVGEAVTQLFGISTSQITFNSDIKALFTTRCVSCHGAAKMPNPDRDLRLDFFDRPILALKQFNSAGNRTTQILARTVTRATPAETMPPTGALAQNERDLIQLWAWGNYGAGLAQPDVSFQASAPVAPVTGQLFTINYTPTDTDTPNLSVWVQYRLNNTGAFINIADNVARPVTVAAQDGLTLNDPKFVVGAQINVRIIVDDGTGRQRDRTQNFTIVAP